MELLQDEFQFTMHEDVHYSEIQPIRLIPVTSPNTARYDNSDHVQLCPRVIVRGPSSHTSTSSTAKWTRFVHPEGQSYSVFNSEFGFVVVTEADISDTQNEQRILDCLEVANHELQCHNIKLPSQCELFLQLGKDRLTCSYYFVDHAGRALFWLDDVCTELLEIPSTMSSSHLGMALERLYWVHVEFFPMHHKNHEQDFSQIVDDLYNIISHGQADRLTSRTSTFPFTSDICQHFLKLLSKKRGQSVDGYTLCYAARLAGAIANQRFVTFYGEQPAQLDRLQEMCPVNAIQHKWLFTVADFLMWGVPHRYTSLLEDLFMNEQVYVDQWTHFVSLCLADWTSSLSWSFPVLIASILLVTVRGGTVSASVPSVFSSAVCIASASCLHLRHQPFVGSTATVGARYLRFSKSNIVGFLLSSVAFSLPRASYLWGVCSLTAQFLFVASHSVGKLATMTAGVVIFAILLFVLCVIYPEDVDITSLYKYFISLFLPHQHALETRINGSIV